MVLRLSLGYNSDRVWRLIDGGVEWDVNVGLVRAFTSYRVAVSSVS
jgi:hypothetical protein